MDAEPHSGQVLLKIYSLVIYSLVNLHRMIDGTVAYEDSLTKGGQVKGHCFDSLCIAIHSTYNKFLPQAIFVILNKY